MRPSAWNIHKLPRGKSGSDERKAYDAAYREAHRDQIRESNRAWAKGSYVPHPHPSVVARRAGEKRYNTGKPCRFGHMSDRYTNSTRCVECVKLEDKARRPLEAQKRRESSKVWRQSAVGKSVGRKIRLKRFGVDQAWYDRKIQEQGGACAVCKNSDPGKGRKFFSIDHCHLSGRARGLLCSPCNIAIGGLKDCPLLLRAALEYLEKAHAG